MENIDLAYICAAMGNLCGIPIRLFAGTEQTFFSFHSQLVRDPMELCREDIFRVTGHVGYCVTTDFDYYGIVIAGETRLVIGPARQIPRSEQELRELAFRLDVPKEETNGFLTAVRSIIPMPLESVMQSLCMVNYVLSGEKLGLGDVVLHEAEQGEMVRSAVSRLMDAPDMSEQEVHNTLSLERQVMDLVERGDVEGLREWASHAPAVRAGIMAPDQLRQVKNSFIVTATLAARAAIRGGLEADEALSLSDAYIQQCELLGDVGQITNLQFNMVLTFTQRVARLRAGTGDSPLALQVKAYVLRHLSEPITAEAMAADFYMSRPYLSAKFKAETGVTLTDFVLNTKTEDAKRLLRFTDKSLTQIAAYLGFSSPGHFSRVFRKYAGMSPKEFRLTDSIPSLSNAGPV